MAHIPPIGLRASHPRHLHHATAAHVDQTRNKGVESHPVDVKLCMPKVLLKGQRWRQKDKQWRDQASDARARSNEREAKHRRVMEEMEMDEKTEEIDGATDGQPF